MGWSVGTLLVGTSGQQDSLEGAVPKVTLPLTVVGHSQFDSPVEGLGSCKASMLMVMVDNAEGSAQGRGVWAESRGAPCMQLLVSFPRGPCIGHQVLPTREAP